MSLTLTRRYNVDRFGYLIPHRYGNLPMLGAVATYRPGEGRFGGAVAVEEGTENYIPPAPYAVYTGRNNGMVEKVTPHGVIEVFEFEKSSSSRARAYYPFPVEEGGTYTVSCVAKSEGEGAPSFATFRAWPEGGAASSYTILSESQTPLGDGWFYLVVTLTINSTNRDLFVAMVGGAVGQEVGDKTWVYNYQAESKPFATSFVDGTRAAGRLSYPVNFNMDEGAIRVLFYLDKSTVLNATATYPTVFMARQGTGTRNWLWVYFNSERTRLNFQRRTDSGSQSGGTVELSNFDELSDGWHDVAIVWDHASGVIRAYLDGEFKGTATYDKNDLIPLDRIDVGCRQGASDVSNLLFDELLILPYAASEEEIRAWYEADGPIPPHPDALLQWDWQAVRPATMVAL